MKKNTYTAPGIESDTIETLSARLLEVTDLLFKSNEKLKKEQKERQEMLANISHDLRAPITAIRSAIDYLTSSQELSKEDIASSLQLIDRRTLTLENMIQDMYYLFCVEDTSKEFTFESVNASAFLEEYFYDTIVDSRYDSHHMVLDLDPQLNCKISIDVQKFVRVLDNLFTNAAKYSQENSTITLKAYLSCKDKHPNTLCIEVIDNGVGIPKEALPNIFNRTYTVSSSRTPNSTTGSGLGLSIAKAIVERHGGEICCKSEIGKGSTFMVLLPITDD